MRRFLVMLAALTLVCGLNVASSCEADVRAELANRNTNEGEGQTTYKFRVEASHRGESCAAVEFKLVLRTIGSDGEQFVPIRRQMKVHGGTMSMLVEHRLPSDTTMQSYNVEDVSCNVCGPGD